jgi:hypothetical protein
MASFLLHFIQSKKFAKKSFNLKISPALPDRNLWNNVDGGFLDLYSSFLDLLDSLVKCAANFEKSVAQCFSDILLSTTRRKKADFSKAATKMDFLLECLVASLSLPEESSKDMPPNSILV